ncbi:hypothetical protein J4216_05665 [Candidatus Woesearchaeota archaeon]|nr:hypothetical protein [Candidatus Woesearchaeota archaeon]
MDDLRGRLLAIDDRRDALDVIRKVAYSKDLGYQELPIKELLSLVFWENTAITQNDLVVLDVNLEDAVDLRSSALPDDVVQDYELLPVDGREGSPTHVVYRPTQYNGLDVFTYLVRWKKDGKLSGLTKLLLNTTLISHLSDPRVLSSPNYEQSGFNVYTLKRTANLRRQATQGVLDLNSYESILSGTVEGIYSGIANPVNGNKIVKR